MLELVTTATDAKEAARRIADGFTTDVMMPQLAPSEASIIGVVNDSKRKQDDRTWLWHDPQDPEQRNVFLMHEESDGWFVNYGFGVEKDWPAMFDAVVDTFINAKMGDVPLRFPGHNKLGDWAAQTLFGIKPLVSKDNRLNGLYEITANTAKPLITAYRKAHP